tara:strand:- start:260 stop:544 length:285 start_codon:yes stop_codon:yes gene_type:complete
MLKGSYLRKNLVVIKKISMALIVAGGLMFNSVGFAQGAVVSTNSGSTPGGSAGASVALAVVAAAVAGIVVVTSNDNGEDGAGAGTGTVPPSGRV